MFKVEINLEKLPKTKLIEISKLLEDSSTNEKNNFIRGLIYLGFNTIKNPLSNNIIYNITRSPKTESCNKIRIYISDKKLNDVLSTFDTQSQKRSFIYSLFFSGLSLFLELLDENSKVRSEMGVSDIEKQIFLSGLSEIFDNYTVAAPRSINKKNLNTYTSPLTTTELIEKTEPQALKIQAPNEAKLNHTQVADTPKDSNLGSDTAQKPRLSLRIDKG